MSVLDEIYSYPEISFMGDLTLDGLIGEMIADFTSKYAEITGEKITLAKSDPNRMILYAAALQIYQGFVNIDKAGKMNYLKYTSGDYLDNLCALKGIKRSQGSAAKTMLRFTLSAEQTSAVTIPMGTRATDGNENYFFTTEVAEIPIGDMTVDVPAESASVGIEANDIEIGEIKTLVDYIPYVDSVENVTKTQGGSGVEDDESLKERFYLAPSGYSVAGSEAGYEYWTKAYNTGITDVLVTSPEPCVVKIYVLLEGGQIPEELFLEGLEAYLEDGNIRPLTDQVSVNAPDQQEYSVQVTYYISKTNTSNAVSIQSKVQQAVENYIAWQSEKIGRDINPDVLIQNMVSAGAKRVEVTSPIYQVIGSTGIAQLSAKTVTYGGIEDD